MPTPGAIRATVLGACIIAASVGAGYLLAAGGDPEDPVALVVTRGLPAAPPVAEAPPATTSRIRKLDTKGSLPDLRPAPVIVVPQRPPTFRRSNPGTPPPPPPPPVRVVTVIE